MAGLHFGSGIDTKQWKSDLDKMRRDVLSFSDNTLGELSSKLKKVFSEESFDIGDLNATIGDIVENWEGLGLAGEEEFNKINRLVDDVINKQKQLADAPNDPTYLSMYEHGLEKAKDNLTDFVDKVKSSNSDIVDFKKNLQETIKKNFFSDTGEVMITDLKRARDEARKVYQDLVKDRDKVAKELDKMPSSGAKNELTGELNKINREVAKSKVAMEQYGKVYDQVQGQGQALYTRINHLRVSMQQLDTTTAEGAKRYMELSKELTDVQIKIRQLNQQTSVMSRGGVGIQAFAGGFRALSGTMTTATGLMTLFNVESENMEKQMVRLQSLMSVSIGVEQLMNTTRRDGALMTSISVLQIRARAKAEALATQGTRRATIAQRAFNLVANANPYVLLGTALLTVVGALALFSKANRAAVEEQKKMNKAVAEGMSGDVVQYKILQKQWEDAGTSLEKKNKAIKAFNDKLGDSYGVIENTNNAENIFAGEGTDSFLEAIKLRAEADYLYTKATEDYAKARIKAQKLADDYMKLESGTNYEKTLVWLKGIWKGVRDISFGDAFDPASIREVAEATKESDKATTDHIESLEKLAGIRKELGLVDKTDKQKPKEITLKQQIDEMRKLWEEYYKTVDQLGKDSANSIFGDAIDTDSNFISYVRKLRDEFIDLENKTIEQVEAMNMYSDLVKELTGQESAFDKNLKDIKEFSDSIPLLTDRLEWLREAQSRLGESSSDLRLSIEYSKMIDEIHAERKAMLDDLIKNNKDFEDTVKDIYIDRDNKLSLAINEAMRISINAEADKKILDAYIEVLKKSFPELNKVLSDMQNATKKELQSTRKILVNQLKSTEDVIRKSEVGKLIQEIDFHLQKLDDNPLKQIAESFKIIKKNAKDADVVGELGKMGVAIGAIARDSREAIGDIAGISEDLGIRMDNDFGDLLGHLDETFEGFQMVAEGMEMMASKNPVEVVAGTIKVIGGLVKAVGNWFNNDKKKERQTERILKQIRELESAYNDLEYAMNSALGTDRYKGQLNLMRNLLEQQRKLSEAITKENSKKKADKGRIEDWEEQKKEIDRQIKDIQASIRDELLTTDVKSFADRLSDALVSAFKDGENAANNLNKTVDELFENMLKNALSLRMQKELDAVFNDIQNSITRGGSGGRRDNWLSQDEISKYKDRIKDIADTNAEWLKMYEDVFGSDISKPDTLKGAIQGMSQETADILAGQFNMIRIDTATIVSVMNRNEDRFIQSLTYLAGIERNTYVLHQMGRDISDMNSKISSIDTRSTGL